MSRHGANIHSMKTARKMEKDLHKIRDQIIKWKQSPRSKNWQIEQLDTIRTHLTCALMSLWVAFPDLVDEGGGGE